MADHCVRAGATGTGTGEDWTNAFTSVPATLVRGDTYFVADGDYDVFTFNTALSGTEYCRVLKATESAHGPETGWSSSYGDGNANFNPTGNYGISIRTGYFILDGVVGFGETKTNYGFVIDRTSGEGLSRSELVTFGTFTVSHVQVSHMAAENCGSSWDIPQYNLYSNSYQGESTHITISHNYFNDGSSNMLFRGWHDSIVEYNCFGDNWSSGSNHGQSISPGADSDDIIMRGNLFRGSTIFIIGTHTDNNHRWHFYNNLVIGGNTLTAGVANADSGTSDVVLAWEVHHNTFVNVDFGGRGAVFVGTLTGGESDESNCHNNIFYNCIAPRMDNPGFTAGAINYGYNAFLNCTGTVSSTGDCIVDTYDPFTDRVGEDFSLARAMPGKQDLGSDFENDFDGNLRGEDNVIDMGAYEYDSGASAPIYIAFTA